MISDQDVAHISQAAALIPPAQAAYLEDDFITNLMATVLDYQMNTAAVVRSIEHYKTHRWDEIRTLDDLMSTFRRFSNSQEGNTALAQYLWGYNLWTRAEQLRMLARFFRSIGVRNQEELKTWAETSTFKRDFEGRVKGLGIAVYHWLVMRQGVDTVKPDVHVRRFAEGDLGRSLNDRDVVEVITRAAHGLGLKAYELDWAIWEWSRNESPPDDQPDTPAQG